MGRGISKVLERPWEIPGDMNLLVKVMLPREDSCSSFSTAPGISHLADRCGRSCDESSTTLSAYKGSFGLFLVFSALLLLGCQIQPQVGHARAFQVVVRGWYVMAFQLVPACKQAVERRLVLVNGIDLGERWRSIGPSDLGV